MKFVYYTDWNQLPDSADALFAHCERASLFLSRPWLANVAASLADGEGVALACVVREDRMLAMLPLLLREGAGGYALKHRYTTHYSLLLAQDDQDRVLACLAEGLSQLSIRALLLEPVGKDDVRLDALQRALEATGAGCDHAFRFYNWIHRVQGQTYAEYMSERPARLRNTIARKRRKLKREHGFAIRLYTDEQAPAKMHDYYAAYSSSWKANEQYVGFLNRVVADCSRRGWTRLAVLYVNDKPVAAQLWFVVYKHASIFRLAYDEAWKAYSPGSILTDYLMEYVIDTDKVELIDFLTGNEAYKRDWMSERRERFALSCVKNVEIESGYQRLVKRLKRVMWRR